MLSEIPDPAARETRTLIRNARQLLTLHGASGPRRGSAMSQLNIVANGAVLIRNGIIEETGPARRVENLSFAKSAREIDASGRIVMPAFVDPDVSLVSQPPGSAAISTLSPRKVELSGSLIGAERARYGCVTVGSHTACATDLTNTIKVLRAHRALQSKPLRIRSVYSHGNISLEQLESKWLPAIRKEKLASVLEFTLGDTGAALPPGQLRYAAIAASGAGFALRFRSPARLQPAALLLALSSGAISILSPIDSLHAFTGPLATIGCVRVIPVSEAFEHALEAEQHIRRAIDNGAAIALSSSYRSQGASSFNMQFLLHLAVQHLGMSAEEAIMATTYNAACSLRLSHVTGSLEPGKSADLVMMDVPDYRELPRRAGHYDLSLVMRAGQVLYRRTLLAID